MIMEFASLQFTTYCLLSTIYHLLSTVYCSEEVLDMKVKEIIFMVEEDPGGGYVARALGHSIFTEGETLEELRENIKDALECHFDTKEEIPSVVRLHIVKEETFTYA